MSLGGCPSSCTRVLITYTIEICSLFVLIFDVVMAVPSSDDLHSLDAVALFGIKADFMCDLESVLVSGQRKQLESDRHCAQNHIERANTVDNLTP